MTYTTNQLIADAYHASNVVSREFESVNGNEINIGLKWLNELLGLKVVEADMIPYERSTTFTAVANQEEYSVDDLIYVSTLTFVKDSVRYSMMFQDRDSYKGNSRVQTIDSLPYKYFWEKQFGGAKIYLYFLPDDTYTFTVNGIFRLSEVALNQDLELTLDKFYITYLQYELAERICIEFGFDVPPGVRSYLSKLQDQISKTSRTVDLSGQKRSTLGRPGRFGWAWTNLSSGWIP